MGFYAERAVAIPRGLLPEDAEQLAAFVDQCVADLDPCGPIQELVARQIAVALLRVLRFEAYEALQLARAGRLPTTAGQMVSAAGEEAELDAEVDALDRFQRWAAAEGDRDLTGVDEERLLKLLPAGVDGVVRPPSLSSSAATDSTTERLGATSRRCG